MESVSGIDSLDTPFVGDEQATALQLVRARKFAALATLFRLDAERYPSAVRTLLTPCPGILDCPVRKGAVRQSGVAAAAWSASRRSRDSRAIGLEHSRLFGGADVRTDMPLIPACACSYLFADVDGSLQDIERAYAGAGFVPLTEAGRCPAHVSNELDFMAYCLAGGAVGDAASLDTGRAFMISHLFGWGVVFAAATYARAEHPVLRFAGEMLEHLLFCDLEAARRTAAGYAPLAQAHAARPA